MKKLSLILFFIFIACSTTQEIESTQEYKVADDFIPTSEIVWCKANYKTFQNLVKIFEDDGEYAFNKEMNKLTTDQVEEVQDKFKYLQETVDYLAPEYTVLSWKMLLALDSFLDLDVEKNPDDFDLLVKATSVCTTWYNSTNN